MMRQPKSDVYVMFYSGPAEPRKGGLCFSQHILDFEEVISAWRSARTE